MKKILPLLLIMLLVSGCTKSYVLDTDLRTAEQVLDDTVKLNNYEFVTKDADRHIYYVSTINLYAAKPTSTNNYNFNSKESAEGTIENPAGFACTFKSLKPSKTLAICEKKDPKQLPYSSSSNVLSGSAFGLLGSAHNNSYGYPQMMYLTDKTKEYFKQLRANGISYVSYKKYLKGTR